MTEPLTQERIVILQAHVDAGDRVAYYSQLADWGYQYAELALGVVNNNTLAGRIANEFFDNNAREQGINVSNNQLAAISIGLFDADFDVRTAPGSAAINGQRLNFEDIQDYHQSVFFDEVRVSPQAWTPFFILDNLETDQERDAFWGSLLGNLFDQIAVYQQALLDLEIRALQSDDISFGDVVEYEVDIIGAGITAQFNSPSGKFGPYNISNPNGNGRIIGGGSSRDGSLTGSGSNDVIHGFAGNDTLSGGGGDDRIYGGEGSDTFIADAGSDFLAGDSDILAETLSEFTGPNDIVDYSEFEQGIIINPDDFSESEINDGFVSFLDLQGVTTVRSADTDVLLGIERIIATDFDDVFFVIESDNFSPADIEFVDLGDEGDMGDLVSFSELAFGVTFNIERNTAQRGTLFVAQILDAENVVGGMQADEITGDDEDNIIIGREGNDQIEGEDGNDELLGGSGNDELDGGVGNDIIFGDFSDENKLDLEEENSQGGSDKLEGGAGNDQLFGGEGGDEISGGRGGDELFHNNAANEDDNASDTLDGGAGDGAADTFNAGDGDVIRNAGTEDTLIINGEDVSGTYEQEEEGGDYVLYTDESDEDDNGEDGGEDGGEGGNGPSGCGGNDNDPEDEPEEEDEDREIKYRISEDGTLTVEETGETIKIEGFESDQLGITLNDYDETPMAQPAFM